MSSTSFFSQIPLKENLSVELIEEYVRLSTMYDSIYLDVYREAKDRYFPILEHLYRNIHQRFTAASSNSPYWTYLVFVFSSLSSLWKKTCQENGLEVLDSKQVISHILISCGICHEDLNLMFIYRKGNFQ